MPKKRNKAPAKAKKAKNGIPKHGRSEKDVMQDIGLHDYAGDVPLGNNDPTVVQGVMYGNAMKSIPRGNLRQFRGKYT